MYRYIIYILYKYIVYICMAMAGQSLSHMMQKWLKFDGRCGLDVYRAQLAPKRGR